MSHVIIYEIAAGGATAQPIASNAQTQIPTAASLLSEPQQQVDSPPNGAEVTPQK